MFCSHCEVECNNLYRRNRNSGMVTPYLNFDIMIAPKREVLNTYHNKYFLQEIAQAIN